MSTINGESQPIIIDEEYSNNGGIALFSTNAGEQYLEDQAKKACTIQFLEFIGQLHMMDHQHIQVELQNRLVSK